MSIREAIRNPMCSNCGGASIIGEISLEEEHLRIENARLKDELDRVCALASKFMNRPITSLPNSSSVLGSNNGMNDFGILTSPLGIVSQNSTRTTTNMVTSSSSNGFDRSMERSMLLELALAATDELMKMAQNSEPLWINKSFEGGREILNHEEYTKIISTPNCKQNGFVYEASRETGVVIINSLALVETLMDSVRLIQFSIQLLLI